MIVLKLSVSGVSFWHCSYVTGHGLKILTLAMQMSIIKFLRDRTFYIKLGLKPTFFEITVKRIKKNIHQMQI
jgi:hypothetical protein